MLLLNPIVRKTSEKRSRWWTRLAGFGLWSVLQPICMSLNIRSIKEEHDDVYTAPFLVALGTTARWFRVMRGPWPRSRSR